MAAGVWLRDTVAVEEVGPGSLLLIQLKVFVSLSLLFKMLLQVDQCAASVNILCEMSIHAEVSSIKAQSKKY